MVIVVVITGYCGTPNWVYVCCCRAGVGSVGAFGSGGFKKRLRSSVSFAG